MVNQRKAGAILSYVSLVVNAVIALIYVPLLLGFLTTNEYGVYELIGSIIAYLSVMDLGLSTTLNRFYVKTKVAQDRTALENLLAMAAIIYGFLTVVAVIVGFGFYFSLDALFANTFSASELALAHQMMLLVILNCIIVLPGNWFLAIINANERFVFARTLSIIKYLAQVTGVLLVLSWQANALNVLIVQVIINLVSVVFYFGYCKTRLQIKAKLYKWDWRLLWSLLTFSFFILLNMVFDQVFWKTGQVVLGAVTGAAAVAVYGVATKLITSAYMQVSTGVTSVFLPKLTEMVATTQGNQEVNDLFNRIGRIQSVLVWGACAVFILIGDSLIFLWAGTDFAEAYPAVVILMLGLSVALVQNLGITILQAKNKMAFRSIVYIALAILDVVISIPVSAHFGVTGCAVVAAVLLFVGTGPVMNIYYHKVIGLDIPKFWSQALPLVIPAIITSLISYTTFTFFQLPLSWASLAFEALIFMSVYFALLWFGWFNDYEKNLLFSILQKLKLRKRGKPQ